MTNSRIAINGRTAIIDANADGTHTVTCGFTDSVTSEFRCAHYLPARQFKTETGATKFAARFVNRKMSLLPGRYNFAERI